MRPLNYKADLDLIGQCDVPGLTDKFRNRIYTLAERGLEAEAEWNARWWLDAFGDDVVELARVLGGLRESPAFDAARRKLVAKVRHMRAPLAALDAAIASGSVRSYKRWRFAGLAYARRLHEFADRLEVTTAIVRAEQEGATSLLPELRQWRVLSAAVDAHLERRSKRDTDERSAFHCLRRAATLAEVATILEADHQLRYQHLQNLQSKTNTLPGRNRARTVTTPADVREEIRRLECIIVDAAAAADIGAARSTGIAGSDAIRRAVGLTSSDENNNLIRELVQRLNRSQSEATS